MSENDRFRFNAGDGEFLDFTFKGLQGSTLGFLIVLILAYLVGVLVDNLRSLSQVNYFESF